MIRGTFVFALLLLIGCSPRQAIIFSASKEAKFCSQDVNEALVWIERDGFVDAPLLSYYLGSKVVASRRLSLNHHTDIGFAAFQKKDREKLRVCGKQLEHCIL